MTSLSPVGIMASFAIETNVVGQDAFTTPGQTTWTAPAGVTSISMVLIGGGGGGADLNGAGAAVDIVSRGNLVTTAEINAYNGASDFRPKSAVKENGTYIIVANGSTLSLNVKCRKVFIVQATGGNQAVCQVTAELTSIEEGYDCDYRGIPGISGGVRGTMFLKSQGA